LSDVTPIPISGHWQVSASAEDESQLNRASGVAVTKLEISVVEKSHCVHPVAIPVSGHRQTARALQDEKDRLGWIEGLQTIGNDELAVLQHAHRIKAVTIPIPCERNVAGAAEAELSHVNLWGRTVDIRAIA